MDYQVMDYQVMDSTYVCELCKVASTGPFYQAYGPGDGWWHLGNIKTKFLNVCEKCRRDLKLRGLWREKPNM